MIRNSSSTWGVKRSGENIRAHILGIITNANEYIIIGGYNFTFKTAGYAFFSELHRKSIQGVPILMIIPPNLSGNNKSHQDAINFCIANGIGIILNGNNHSKWILTENDLYYGSSNFSEYSWKSRVEVISIHDLSTAGNSWKIRTVNDFKGFVKEEIFKIHKRKIMTRRHGLIVYTRIVWNNIKTKMLKLNPSIEKVILTLENFEYVSAYLETVCANWFESEYFDDYLQIRELSKTILKKANKLCYYAYTNIYNESLISIESKNQNIDVGKDIINAYNNIHIELIESIDYAISQLEKFELRKSHNMESKNQIIIDKFDDLLKGNFS